MMRGVPCMPVKFDQFEGGVRFRAAGSTPIPHPLYLRPHHDGMLMMASLRIKTEVSVGKRKSAIGNLQSWL